jgi:NAD(P)-dependent dehydrogenase (short-subunit alcohol dehydrogenase family)
VGQAASVRDMVRRAVEAFGRLDILVNSAAIDPKFEPDRQARRDGSPEKEAPPSPGSFQPAFENYPLELWKQALDVNLTGAFLCCQAAAGPMLEQGSGVMVNLSSIYGLTGPDQRIYQRNDQKRQFKPVHYSVTKAGLVGLTRYLAAYYAGMNIRVNTLTPGGVYNQHDPEFVAAYASRTILGRMAQKNDLNGALLFLVSEASSYMTGANLIVDGGWTAW